MYTSLLALSLTSAVVGQQAGTTQAEKHPPMPMSVCTASGCNQEQTSVVLDANWRWCKAAKADGGNCYSGNKWDATLCPDGKTCAQNCALEGADYEANYGITTPSQGALKLSFVKTNANGKNVGSRLYLLKSETEYRTFNLLNKEFSFDVDTSKLVCGLNGAVYFVQMDADGGMAKHPGNKAGAKYGTGYCDAQCARDIKFINGEANSEGWNSTDENSGTGKFGSCCSEMDVWEANSISAAFTPHACSADGATRCENDKDCAVGADNRYAGVCDPDGCDFNSFRMGDTGFYGPSKVVDTSKPFTVVTQFITSDGTDTGTLSEIRRFYVQNGKTIPNSMSNIVGVDPTNSITDNFCSQTKTAFGDVNYHATKGGLAQVGKAIQNVVLALSIWDDHAVSMNWLDSTFPPGKTGPGVARGTCDPADGDPKTLEANHADASVTYSNLKLGPLMSTFQPPPSRRR